MFSFVKKVVSSVIPWNSNVPENNLDREEEELINSIKTYLSKEENLTHGPVELSSKTDALVSDVESFKLVHKTGKITHLCEECGLIDDIVYFETNRISHDLQLKFNDEVLYTAYKAKENESERVFKVYALKNNSWDDENTLGTICEDNPPTVLPKVETVSAFTRVITGKVTQRKGREVYVESADIWCNLDEIDVSCIPVEGDWIELTAAVSLNEETADLTGNVLLVKSLKPLLKKSGFGRITLWSDITKEGAIEDVIYFTSTSCESGYLPDVGDEVLYDAVESDQDRFRWRAIKVQINNLKMKENTKIKSENSSESQLSDSFSDKCGITISPSVCCITLELNETKTVTFEVTNNGNIKQYLKYTKFHLNKNSQMTLLRPKLTDNFFILPKKSVIYEFQCTGKYLGLRGELFFFHFEDFLIVRPFDINVTENTKLLCNVYKCRNSDYDKRQPDVITYGSKPWKSSKFISKESECVFNIPQKLWDISKCYTKANKYYNAVLDYAPFLKNDLNFEYYTLRFHILLYLEEMEIRINFKKFSLKDVSLKDEEDFLVLKVPGLAEKRPSLIVGDKIMITQPWLDKGETMQIGYVYDIQAKEVYIKFSQSFHDTYDGSECDVEFEPNVNIFTKLHNAVNRAVKVLGEEWLFPTVVKAKPPKIDVNLPEELEILSENDVKCLKTKAKTKKKTKRKSSSLEEKDIQSGEKVQSDISTQDKNLVWVNKNLNRRQKLAVVNALYGIGRPLPYIIFGPPGTGKTVTLVEIIIQIYRLMPESRILITTPSNSAADLICERLIEMANFKPGQLVRLLAMYRVIENLVPEKLIPYSTFLSGKKNNGKNHSKVNYKNKIRESSFSELIGMHRITVATCTSIGYLHYSGLRPGHFTHILVDEAGQSSEPEVLISATFLDVRNGQIILTGDPQQLGPVICSKMAKDFGLGKSLLQRLISNFPYARDVDGFPKTSGFDPRFITRLNLNYRSVPEILSLPSKLFYDSDLIPKISQTKGEEAEIIKKFNFQVENRTTPPAIIFHGVEGQNLREINSPSWFNPHEIWNVVFYLRKLYSIGLDNNKVGIVSPYLKQVQKLKDLLPSLELPVPKIGTVEEFQGQERQVIILTTVRSAERHIKSDIIHSLGFVASPQRLNVALTRARALLIIIGNPLLLSRDPYWVSVVKYCVKNNSYVGCSLKNLFEENDEKENV